MVFSSLARGRSFVSFQGAGGILFLNLEKPRSTSGWVVCQALRFFFVRFWIFSSVKSPQKVQLTGTFGRWYSGHHPHFGRSGPGSIPGGGAYLGIFGWRLQGATFRIFRVAAGNVAVFAVPRLLCNLHTLRWVQQSEVCWRCASGCNAMKQADR